MIETASATTTRSSRSNVQRVADRILSTFGSRSAKLRELESELQADRERLAALGARHADLRRASDRASARLAAASSKVPLLRDHCIRARDEFSRWLASSSSGAQSLIESGARLASADAALAHAEQVLPRLERERDEAQAALESFESEHGNAFELPDQAPRGPQLIRN